MDKRGPDDATLAQLIRLVTKDHLSKKVRRLDRYYLIKLLRSGKWKDTLELSEDVVAAVEAVFPSELKEVEPEKPKKKAAPKKEAKSKPAAKKKKTSSKKSSEKANAKRSEKSDK